MPHVRTVRFILVFLSSAALHAQPPSPVTWDPPQRISFTPYNSVYPRLFAFGDTVHLFWSASDGPDALYRRSTDGGKSWDAIQTIIDTVFITNFFPATTNQFAYAFFSRYSPSSGLNNPVIIRSLTAGAGFLPLSELAAIPNTNTYNGPTSARDSSVIYVSPYSTTSGGRARLGWSNDAGVGWLYTQGSTTPRDQVLFLSSGVHNAREMSGGSAPETAYLYSSNYGATWTTPFPLSTFDSQTSDEQVIAGTDEGKLYTVWRDGKYGSIGGFGASIILRRSIDFGLSWFDEQLLTTQPAGLFPQVSADGNHVAVVWVDDRQGSTRFRISTDGGASFFSEESLAAGRGSAIAISRRNVHVAWWEDVNGRAEIFYVKGRIAPTSVAELNSIPKEFALSQNYPNPFNGQTTIEFEVPQQAFVEITIHDLLGRQVATVMNKLMHSGTHSVQYNAAQLASGVYLYRMRTSGFQQTKKIVLIR
jgi:hypothetical protein